MKCNFSFIMKLYCIVEYEIKLFLGFKNIDFCLFFLRWIKYNFKN